MEIEAVERINAGLVSSKAILEGELSRFKQYMRETGEGDRYVGRDEMGEERMICLGSPFGC